MVIKDENKTRKWRVQLSYKDPVTGKSARKQKRGFDTKKEAQEWERNFLNSLNPTTDITFANLVEAYLEDMKNRIRESTMETKKNIIYNHLTPYFEDLQIKDLSALTVRKWQAKILKLGYSDTYIKTINNQLSAVMNYAVSYYGLAKNPVQIAGSIGKKNADEMKFWTYEEFTQFINVVTDDFHRLVFILLFYSGVRIGELLGLTPSDFDFEENTISISKTYVVVKGVGRMNPPKTPKGNRVLFMPEFVMDLAKEQISKIYGIKGDDRIFLFARSYPSKLINKYIKKTNLSKIRVHDFRHSHASFLISLDVNIMTLADRLGHEKVETTWNTYGHLYPNKRSEVVDKLNNAIFTPQINKK